eukprot:Clim_evm9s191 gene=Clim_evmTU9s191
MADHMTSNVEDIRILEEQYNNEVIKNAGKVSRDTKFAYAWALIHSQYTKDVQYGIKLLNQLVEEYGSDRDILYALALGYSKCSEYRKAEQFCAALLEREPENRQANKLLQDIQERLRNDAFVGAGLGAAATIAAGALAFGLVKALTRSKR